MIFPKILVIIFFCFSQFLTLVFKFLLKKNLFILFVLVEVWLYLSLLLIIFLQVDFIFCGFDNHIDVINIKRWWLFFQIDVVFNYRKLLHKIPMKTFNNRHLKWKKILLYLRALFKVIFIVLYVPTKWNTINNYWLRKCKESEQSTYIL